MQRYEAVTTHILLNTMPNKCIIFLMVKVNLEKIWLNLFFLFQQYVYDIGISIKCYYHLIVTETKQTILGPVKQSTHI